MQDFRKLSVWQRARQLTKTVYQLTVDYPESEVFGLRGQMRRASVSICANIAEGRGRRGDAQFRHYLDIAVGSACELECETILSFDLAFMTEAAHEQLLDAIIEIKRMLVGLIMSLTAALTRSQSARPKGDAYRGRQSGLVRRDETESS